MKKIILLTLAFFSLYATNIDNDLDGVIDSQDKCLGTPFLELVDKNGCSKQQLQKKSKVKLNISIGYEYDKYSNSQNNLFLSNIMAYTKHYSFIYSISTLHSKTNDSILSLYYKKFISSKIRLKAGIKTYFTTSYNKKTDYAFKIQATYYSKWSISLSEKHKIYTETGTNDKDTITLEAGKTINNFYISPYTYTENSAYDENKWSYYGGIYTQYFINKYSIALDLSSDLKNSSNYSIVTTLGYSF